MKTKVHAYTLDPPADVLTIDRYNLIGELVRQPLVYQEWAESLAAAKAEVDRLKGAMDLVEAEISAAIRDDPDKYEVPKATVDAIKGAVIRHNDFQEAQEAYHKAKEEAGKLDAMVWAINHKKTSLELIVQLEVSGMNAEPRLPKAEAARVKDARRDKVARDTQG